jgi:hypothetical protein
MKEIPHIARLCAELRDDALAAERPFLAHLLDMVIHECNSNENLPINKLILTADYYRSIIAKEEQRSHSNN